MRAPPDAITLASAVAHVRGARTTVTAPKPVAIAGARVARAGRDRVEERVARTAIIDAYVEPGITLAPRTFSVVVDGDETTVEDGLDCFDRALELARRCAPDSYEDSSARHLAAMLATLEAHARRALAAEIESAIAQANRGLSESAEFALDLIDESPSERRASVAERARAMVAATLDEKQPALVLAPRAMISVRSVARVARWRLSNEAGWATIETEARSDTTRLHARCPHCNERSATWALCDQCVEARCGRCARRCARCRRTGCVRCSPAIRCATCGLATMERIHDS